ncbi:MAG: hypothetical protein ACRBCJ_13325 [Hyphomicrobiaceae bacterium]
MLAPSATTLPPSIGLLIQALFFCFIPLRFVTKNYLYRYGSDAAQNIQIRSCIDEMIEKLPLTRKYFKRRKFVPSTVLPDRDWHALTIPTLLLVRENELPYSAVQVVRRLSAIAARENVSAIAKADHYLTVVMPKRVTDKF